MRISSGHLRLGSSLTRSLAWLPLGVLFGWLWFSVATFDREDRPYLLGDEATYLMQAQSLAWDFDLEYTPADHKRFALSWGAQPDLILHSSDHGETVTYGKPSFYPLYLAPFVRLSPLFGAVVANSLPFSVASLLSASLCGGGSPSSLLSSWRSSSSAPSLSPTSSGPIRTSF